MVIVMIYIINIFWLCVCFCGGWFVLQTVQCSLCTLSSQLMWNILPTCSYGLMDMDSSKSVTKVNDRPHRIITLHILTVSPDHDAGQVHRNYTSISE